LIQRLWFMIRWEGPLPYRMAADPSNQFLGKQPQKCIVFLVCTLSIVALGFSLLLNALKGLFVS